MPKEEKGKGKKYRPVHEVIIGMLAEMPGVCLETISIIYGAFQKAEVPSQDIPELIEAIQTAPAFPEQERLAEETVKTLREQLAEAEKAEAEEQGGGDDEES